jgi:uncharacterized membrane protein YgcG
MGIRKRAAVAVSGLIFAGAAAVTVGVSTPANAGDHHRGLQSVRIYNKNFNFSRSNSQQAQRQRTHQCNDRHNFDHHSRGGGSDGGFGGFGDGFGGSCGVGGGGGDDDGGDD